LAELLRSVGPDEVAALTGLRAEEIEAVPRLAAREEAAAAARERLEAARREERET
jgi:hypothetical protein